MKYVIATGRKNNNVINEYYIIDRLDKYWNINKNTPVLWDKILTKNEFINVYKSDNFYTANIGNESYVKGPEIRMIEGNAGKYFRTDDNKIPEDNLESLPIISGSPKWN